MLSVQDPDTRLSRSWYLLPLDLCFLFNSYIAAVGLVLNLFQVEILDPFLHRTAALILLTSIPIRRVTGNLFLDFFGLPEPLLDSLTKVQEVGSSVGCDRGRCFR